MARKQILKRGTAATTTGTSNPSKGFLERVADKIGALATPPIVAAGAVTAFNYAVGKQRDNKTLLINAGIVAGVTLGAEILVDEIVGGIIPGDDELMSERLLRRVAEPLIVAPGVAAIAAFLASGRVSFEDVKSGMLTTGLLTGAGVMAGQLFKEALWEEA